MSGEARNWPGQKQKWLQWYARWIWSTVSPKSSRDLRLHQYISVHISTSICVDLGYLLQLYRLTPQSKLQGGCAPPQWSTTLVASGLEGLEGFEGKASRAWFARWSAMARFILNSNLGVLIQHEGYLNLFIRWLPRKVLHPHIICYKNKLSKTNFPKYWVSFRVDAFKMILM